MERVVTKNIKISYHDTDCYGVVWHGNFLKYFEEARCEFCEQCGVDLQELEKEGNVFPVAELNIKYKKPAKIFDKVKIITRIKSIGTASIVFEHTVKTAESEMIVQIAEITVVNVKDGKPAKISKELRAKFEGRVLSETA